MTTPRAPSLVGLAYVASSALAAAAQYSAGLRQPAVYVVLGVVTALAMRFRADRWTLVLTLVHLLIAAIGAPPRTPTAWASWVLIATSLATIHLLTPWIPWRHRSLMPSRAAIAVLAQRALACAAVATTAAIVGVNLTN